MNYEPVNNSKETALRQAADNTRNKIIREAYDIIIIRISNKLESDFSRAWKKFPRFENDELPKGAILKEFYTPYCSVKLAIRRMDYMIILTITDQSFRAGYGIRSTELLRMAFEATRYEREGFMIENAIEIKTNNNIEAIYNERVNEKEYQENTKCFNRKMGIKE